MGQDLSPNLNSASLQMCNRDLSFPIENASEMTWLVHNLIYIFINGLQSQSQQDRIHSSRCSNHQNKPSIHLYVSVRVQKEKHVQIPQRAWICRGTSLFDHADICSFLRNFKVVGPHFACGRCCLKAHKVSKRKKARLLRSTNVYNFNSSR